MIQSIEQGLQELDNLSLEQVDALLSSAFNAFDVAREAGDVDSMRDYMSAASRLHERRGSLVASAGEQDGAEGESTGDEGDSSASDAGDRGSATQEEAAATASTESGEEPVEQAQSETEATDGDAGAAATTETTEEPVADAPDPEPETAEVASTAATEDSATEPADEPADTTTEPPSAEAGADDAAATTTTSEETTVTASAVDEETLEVPEDNQPIIASAPAPAIIAGADVQGITAGSPFPDAKTVGKAFINRIRAVKRASGGDGERHTVATIASTWPEERTLDGDIDANHAKVQAVLDEALTASGGFCAPYPVRYDIFGLGVTDRPVRGAMPMFNASRGGVRFVAPPVLGDLEDAVGLWTAANDRNPGEASGDPSTKAEMKVTCAEEQSAETDAVTLQLEFGNFMTRAYPELVNRNNDLALIEHARFAELELLNKIEALSTPVTAASSLGIGRDFLASLNRAAAAYRARHRMPRSTPLRVIAPNWVLDAMRADFSRGLPGDDNIAYADSQINQFLMRQRIRVSWHMDGLFDAQSASSPLVDFPDEFKWFIYAEGTFIYLDGGNLDLGVVRDSGLVSTNDYKTFSETFEGVAKFGVEGLVVTQQSAIDGATVGTVEPAGAGS